MISAETIRRNLINLPQLVFEVTDACNLRCKYCGYSSLYEGYDKRENRKLSFAKAKCILDYLTGIWKAEYTVGIRKSLTISFYGGEPLLNMRLIRDVVDYVKSINSIGKTVNFNMTTNAMLLDRYMDYLVANEFRLLISIDGDEHSQGYRIDIEGNNSFDKVFKNVKLLQEKHPRYFEKFVMFNSVLHNKNSVESIYYFIKHNFGKEPSISPLSNSGIKPDKINEFNKIYQNYSSSINSSYDCERLKDELFTKNPQTVSILDYLQFYSGNIFNNYNALLRSSEVGVEISTGTCIPFSKKMFITVNGKILQCEKISHDYALGKVTESDVILDLPYVSEMYNSLINVLAQQCHKCSQNKKCPQCVFQIDNLQKNAVICPSFLTAEKNKIAKIKTLLYLRKHPSLYGKLMSNSVARR